MNWKSYGTGRLISGNNYPWDVIITFCLVIFRSLKNSKYAMRDCDSPKIALENAVLTADEQIRAQSEQYKERRGMATTLIAACVDDALNCRGINVGDSRAQIITADGENLQ